MRFLLLSALAGMAVTSQPKLLVDRQDYTVHGGALVDCAPEYECGIYCRTSNYFCCKDGSHPCRNGDYCLGTNACCYGNEDISVCAARNGIAVPASSPASAPAPPPSAPVSVIPSSVPAVTPSLLPSSASLPVITPSYPVGNATIPVPTATGPGVTSQPPVVPFTGGAERSTYAGKWVVGMVGAVLGLTL